MEDNSDEAHVQNIRMEDLRIAVEYIRLLREATLANDFVSDTVRAQMHNPPSGILKFSGNKNTILAMKLFSSNPSRIKYEDIREDV